MEESSSGQYLDREDHIQVNSTYDICEEYVNDPECEEKENFLLKMVRNDPEMVPYAAAEYIATDILKSTLEEAFPGLSVRFKQADEPEPPKKKHKKSAPKKSQVVVEEVIPLACDADHEVLSSYKLLISPYYFLEQRKFCNAKCRGCKVPFDTKENAASKTTQQLIPLPSSKPGGGAYVCCNFELDKSACGNFYCTPCSAGAAGSRKRRVPSTRK